MKLKEYAKHYWTLFCEKHEPQIENRIIPNFRTMDFETALESVFRQPSVVRSYVEKCCYVIEIEHLGIRFDQNSKPQEVIRHSLMCIGRFYRKFGVQVSSNEIYADLGKYSMIIRVALNTYGFHQIMQYKRVQKLTF